MVVSNFLQRFLCILLAVSCGGGLLFSSKLFAASSAKPSLPAKAETPEPLDPHRLEWGVIGGPAFSVDTGLEIAALAHLAQFKPGYSPYFWRLRATLKTAFRTIPGGLELPVHDYQLRLELPGLLNNRLRLNAQLGFTWLILQYYGLGNAARGTRLWKHFDPQTQRIDYLRALRRYQYRQWAPGLRLKGRWKLGKSWLWFANLRLQYVGIELLQDSKLLEDVQASQRPPRHNPSAQQALLSGISNHPLFVLQTGVLCDTRNNEFAPYAGWMHEISVRFAPGRSFGLSHAFVGGNLTLRWYQSLYKQLLVFAFRGVLDFLEGHIPFYLLTGTGGLFPADSFGGGGSLRGIRAQRYHGKIKAFANFELRSKLFAFVLKQTYLSFGITAFVDVGRVWLDYQRFQELDGEGPGLHLGAGAGLRVQWGRSLMIRIDIAWSPDASPVGVYFNLGHVF